MLSDVAVTTETTGILKHKALLLVLLGDDVNHTSDGIRTIEGT